MHPLDGFSFYHNRVFEMTLSAAFDESGKYHDPNGRVVFAGFLANQDEWNKLGPKWFTRLRAWNRNLSNAHPLKSDEPFLHMTELNQAHKNGDGTREIELLVKDLAHLIGEHVLEAFANTVTAKEFKALGQTAVKRFKDPFYYAFEACIKSISDSDSMGPRDNAILICDDSDEYSVECLKAYRRLKGRIPDIVKRIPCITFGDDKQYAPLQAADMYAYCFRSKIVGSSESLWNEPLEIIHSVLSDQTTSAISLTNGEVYHGVKKPVANKG
jgi:hypothetical protein